MLAGEQWMRWAARPNTTLEGEGQAVEGGKLLGEGWNKYRGFLHWPDKGQLGNPREYIPSQVIQSFGPLMSHTTSHTSALHHTAMPWAGVAKIREKHQWNWQRGQIILVLMESFHYHAQVGQISYWTESKGQMALKVSGFSLSTSNTQKSWKNGTVNTQIPFC